MLSEVSWEYNDQYYFTLEDGGGSPLLVSFDKKKVEYLQKEKTFAVFKTITLSDFYANESCAVSFYEKIEALAKKHEVDIYSVLDVSDYRWRGIGQVRPVPDSFYESLYELSPDHFFSIREVEVC